VTGSESSDGLSVRWNAHGWAEGVDGEPEQGRWEYWVDDDLVLWWSDSDRQAFHRQVNEDQP